MAIILLVCDQFTLSLKSPVGQCVPTIKARAGCKLYANLTTGEKMEMGGNVAS
jgi:hypothetical protein